MTRFIAVLLVLFIGSVEAQAQTDWEYLNGGSERIIGLLDLPDIVADGCGAIDKRATARLFSTPALTGKLVGTLYMRDEGNAGCGLMIEGAGGVKHAIPNLESGYEIGAAIVYERRGNWFRIALAEGTAWIARKDPADFLPYPELLRKRLGYVQPDWDGVLRDAPGAGGRRVALPAMWSERQGQQVNAEFLDSRRIGNELWLHIQLMKDVCSGDPVTGVGVISGWIPAYRANNAPAAWFSSRGC